MKKLILLRHAECEGSGYIGKGSDVSLSREGFDQLTGITESLKDITIDRILCSTMLRCRQTIEPFIKAHDDIPITYDERLTELDFGIFEGLSYDEILKRYPDEQKNWYADSMNNAPPEGESLKQLHGRINSLCNNVIDDHTDENLLICGHGGSLRALTCELLGLDATKHWCFQIERGKFSVIYIYDKKTTVLHSFNTKSPCHS